MTNLLTPDRIEAAVADIKDNVKHANYIDSDYCDLPIRVEHARTSLAALEVVREMGNQDVKDAIRELDNFIEDEVGVCFDYNTYLIVRDSFDLIAKLIERPGGAEQ